MYNTMTNSGGAARHHLSDILIQFSKNPSDFWKLIDAVRGTQIFGGIGSGKTSGSGRTIAHAFLKSGYGGLVLCAKPDEAGEWEKYAQQCGRQNDIIIFGEGSEYRFNPLQYEMTRSGRGAGLTYNLTELFMSVFKIGQRLSGGSAEEKERFWDNSLKRLLNRLIDLLKLAGVQLSIPAMVELLSCAPQSADEVNLIISERSETQLKKMAENDYFLACYLAAQGRANTPGELRDLELINLYYLRDLATMDDRVRSTISEMFLGFCEPFLSGILNDYFTGETNLFPEQTFEGKIIVLDWSVKDYLVSGIYAQSIFKLLWQQAVERRRVDNSTVPVFLWVDESQYFVSEYDTIFQTTARSSRACTVLLTQNISNYYSYMGGGETSKSKVDSLLGNLATKIFHANNDPETNRWASEVIGQDFIALEGGSMQNGMYNLNITKGQSYSMQICPQVLPIEFTTLKGGGPENNLEVQSIIALSGRKWSNGKNFTKVIFRQDKQ